MTSFNKIEAKAALVLKVCGVNEVKVIEKKWICPSEQCKSAFASVVLLKSHFVAEHNKKPFVCVEPNCNWSFPNLAKLERHKMAHDSYKPFVCDVVSCGKAFKTSFNLKHHKRKFHETAPKFVCPQDNCDASFHNQTSLDYHYSEHTDSSPNYSCSAPGCGRHFVTKSALISHSRCHDRSEEELRCGVCDRIFNVPSRLKLHMMSHSGEKPFVCREPGCNWSFTRSSKLTRHMERHRPVRRFPCTYTDCGKSFIRREHLQDHEVSHTRPKAKTHPRNVSLDNSLPSQETIENTPPPKESIRSGVIGSARTSLTYSDIVVEKETRTSTIIQAESVSPIGPVIDVHITDNSQMNGTCLSEVMQPSSDVLSYMGSLSDHVNFSVQDDLLSQALRLDTTTGLSDLEPSTVNLRDLE